MLNVTLNLPKKAEQELEKDLKKLENITEKPREFHIKKAVVRYLEYADKMIRYYEQQRTKGSPNHTIEELLEHLNLKEIEWEK